MSKPVAPAPEFRQLSETEVHAALNDPDERNPIACEVARLIRGYMENFSAHVERIGRVPESILRVTPETAIEEVAMRLTTETIQAGVANAVRQKMN